MTIGLVFFNNLREADMAITPTGALVQGDPLFTSAVVSLFTRRQAEPVTGAVLPNVPQGWYGDTWRPRPLGSRLWTLRDAKLDQATVRLAQAYAQEALGWWLTSGVAKSLLVTSAQNGIDRIDLGVKARRPDGSRWDHVWTEVELSAL